MKQVHQAQETFVAEVNGHSVQVFKGDMLPDSHELVKLDAGRGLLFTPLEPAAVPVKAPRSGKSAP